MCDLKVESIKLIGVACLVGILAGCGNSTSVDYLTEAQINAAQASLDGGTAAAPSSATGLTSAEIKAAQSAFEAVSDDPASIY